MTDAELICDTLEKAAGKVDDLSPAVYARFFRVHPEARELFGDDDDYMIRGHMFNGILNAFIDQAEGSAPVSASYYWATDHMAYDATLPMFTAMFSALMEELRSLLGSDWTLDAEAAWQRQAALMMQGIESAFAEPRVRISFGGRGKSEPVGKEGCAT